MSKPVSVYKLSLFLSLVLLGASVTTTKAQQFGGNPPSVKWNQVNTPAARVIFQQGMDSVAVNVANVINRINRITQPSIGNRQKQVSIVLQNQTTVPNAYVGLAPFRSEFYLTPQQNSFEIGSYPWPAQLAIHEYRHVQQYNNFNVGMSKVLSVLFGQGGQALSNELSIPNWFFEGDAVFNETQVSSQGRGRLPYFHNGYRAIWQAGKDYSWMKLRNGSYVDYVPDHYQLGYLMVAYGREKYGNDFWKNVTHDAAAYRGGFYPFQRGVRRYAGIDYAQFRSTTLSYFKQQFNADKPTGEIVKKSRHFIANEEYPAIADDSTLIYMKSTYDRRPAFVMRKNGADRLLRIRDVSLDNYFDYHAGKIVYSSYRPDLRWGYRNYSELQLLDVKTGGQRRLTKSTKYFSPALSDDAKTIVAVEVNTYGKSQLHIISADNGEVLAKIPNPGGLFYTYPKFYGDDKLIAAARDSDGEMSLVMIDAATGKANTLADFGMAPIGFLNVDAQTVYFTATIGKNDALYAYQLEDNKIFKIKTPASNIGNYQPYAHNGRLAYVSFTVTGYQVKQVDKNKQQWEQVQGGAPLSNFGVDTLNNSGAANLLNSVSNEPIPVTKYPKAFHLFNFHSLIPDLDDPNYSLSLQGQNVLNTFQSALSVSYNRNEGYKEFGFSAVYGALFPYISAGVNYTVDRRGLYRGNRVYWNEQEAHAGLRVPLTFSSGRHITGLSFGSDWVYNSTNFQSAYRAMFTDRSYTYLNNYITFSNRIQQARQQIYSQFGQTISINYKRAVTGLEANQLLVNGYLYLPGLFKNHSLVINGAHQQKDKNGAISFSNGLPFSRGYTAENLYRLNKAGVNYHFPIAYPDAGVANTIYFLRLRANLFYDYTHASDFYTDGTKFKADFRSTGAEMYFDTQWFNQVPITFGVRYSHLLNNNLFGGNGRNVVELIVPVSIF
jgi:hypothetical protein